VILALLIACAEPATPPVDPPAVVVIVTDTVRADLGGAPRPDWMKDGREYTAAYSAAPWTSSSAVTIATGRYPQTLEERSHPFGAATHCDGTRTPLGVLPRHWPADSWPSTVLSDQPVIHQLRAGESRVPFRGPGSEALVSEAVAALHDPDTGPALLVWTSGAHEPYDGLLPGPGWKTSTVMREVAKSRGCSTMDDEHAAWTRLQYRSAVEHALAGIAPLIGAARASGATVIWTADHGEALGEDGRWGHGSSLDDAQVRVPFWAWGPGVPPGEYTGPVSTACVADIARAVLAGVEPDWTCPGDVVTGMLLADGTWDERIVLAPALAATP
jgi:arylsulfatase A-like enzyme